MSLTGITSQEQNFSNHKSTWRLKRKAFDSLVSHVMDLMLDFQRRNNIKSQCLSNTQYLFDFIRLNSRNMIQAKIKAVIVVGNDKETGEKKTIIHLVILYDQFILDPSYESYSLSNKAYYGNIKSYMSSVKTQDQIMDRQNISNFIYFCERAEEMNEGKFCLAQREFYYQQADYVDSHLDKLNIVSRSVSIPTKIGDKLELSQ